MKKIFLFIILMFVGVISVNAESIYYTNKYNVSFTEEQYNFFTNMYYEGYQEYVTLDDFNYFDGYAINTGEVYSSYATLDVMSLAESVTGTKKSLKISKVTGASGVYITLVADWFQNPTTKSNDVMGARLVSVSLLDTPITKMINSSGSNTFTNIDKFSNGFGQTFLLAGSDIKITQTYKVSSGGTVYASYQHATKSISAANSRKYTLSSNGYGNVFKFNTSVSSYYDNSTGVSVSV